MKNDQFAVYRVDRHSEGETFGTFLSGSGKQETCDKDEYYRQMDIRPLLAGRVQLLYGTHERVL